ncbi:hypothetical protein O6H91_23G041900 [Diphasiastrum complanatum]|uniref:Uncharacterized protein n=1 Tax=Diphasiastrum complanatum TaxID=34168 RepID=A0ACC2AA56_DIPCM|nr:hypothetical protein O6H91_23G041900 [Diphasiastrum complanatum]
MHRIVGAFGNMWCGKIGQDLCRPLADYALHFDQASGLLSRGSASTRWPFHPADHPQYSTTRSPKKWKGNKEDQQSNDGSIYTPSLKREITTQDIFLAKQKETEEGLSYSGTVTDVEGTLLHGISGAVHPTKQTTGSNLGTGHSHQTV